MSWKRPSSSSQPIAKSSIIPSFLWFSLKPSRNWYCEFPSHAFELLVDVESMILCAAMNVSYAWHFTIMKEIIWHTLKGSGIRQIWQNVLHVKLRMRLHSPSQISARSILGKQVSFVTMLTLRLTTFLGMLSLHGPKCAIEVNLLKL